jgi:hypothetical protein
MTDETIRKTRPHRRTRPIRPARAASATRPEPELVDDDFGTEQQPVEALVTTIVSRGTVYGPHPTEKFVSRRDELTGKPVYSPRLVRYRCGCELKLPVSEAKRLIEMGTVVLPGELPLVGPHPDLVVHPDRPEDADYSPDRGVKVHAVSDDGRTILGER